MATKVGDIVPFTPPAEEEQNGETVETVAGEVITPEMERIANERIIKKGFKVFQAKAQEVYTALTIIHTKNLWKQHVDAEGKRKYTSFETYLVEEFGWKLDRTRALQIIKEQRPKLLATGELTAADIPAEKKRTAPEVSPTKAATVTRKQIETVLEAFKDRLNNISNSPGADDLDAIYDNLLIAIQPTLDALTTVIADEQQRATEAAAAEAAEAAEKAEAEAAANNPQDVQPVQVHV